MDYASLKSTVLDWIARQDISDIVFEGFVTIIEQTISAELKCLDLEGVYGSNVKASEESGFGYVLLPSDFREARVVTVGDKTLMYIEPQRFMSDEYNSGFTIVAGKMYFGRGVGSGGAEIIYYKRVPHINRSTLSNAIIDKYPNVYLFGCLREAYSYISDNEKASLYDTRFGRALEEAKYDADTSAYSGSVLTPLAT